MHIDRLGVKAATVAGYFGAACAALGMAAAGSLTELAVAAAAYGSAPELHGAKAYDGAEVMITALRACHACTGLALANAIRAVHYDGLLGSFSYNKQGVGIFATAIGIIKNGKIEPVS